MKQTASDQPTRSEQQLRDEQLRALGLDVVEPSGKAFVIGMAGRETGEKAALGGVHSAKRRF